MAALQELQAILNSLDITQLAIILALAGLLLIFLIFLAVKRRNREDDISVSEMQQYRRNPDSRTTKSQAQAQVRVSEPVASSELKSAQNSTDAEVQRPVVNQADVRAQAVTQAAETPKIPEDSVLRRHYFANEAAKEEALHDPYPADSVLRRHYDTEHRLIGDSSAADAPSVASVAQTNVSGSPQKSSIIEKAVDKSEPTKSVNVAYMADARAVDTSAKREIPQDSILKRHFISQLRAEIEASMAARPSDSVLRRHYESLVGAELEKRLCS